jgi:hypothetical protein
MNTVGVTERGGGVFEKAAWSSCSTCSSACCGVMKLGDSGRAAVRLRTQI